MPPSVVCGTQAVQAAVQMETRLQAQGQKRAVDAALAAAAVKEHEKLAKAVQEAEERTARHWQGVVDETKQEAAAKEAAATARAVAAEQAAATAEAEAKAAVVEARQQTTAAVEQLTKLEAQFAQAPRPPLPLRCPSAAPPLPLRCPSVAPPLHPRCIC